MFICIEPSLDKRGLPLGLCFILCLSEEVCGGNFFVRNLLYKYIKLVTSVSIYFAGF